MWGNHSSIFWWWLWTGTTILQKVWPFLTKSNHIHALCPSNPTSVYSSKRNENMISTKEAYTEMFTPALFKLASLWNHPNCPSAVEWRTKLWCFHTSQYYLQFKEELISQLIWMNLVLYQVKAVRYLLVLSYTTTGKSYVQW